MATQRWNGTAWEPYDSPYPESVDTRLSALEVSQAQNWNFAPNPSYESWKASLAEPVSWNNSWNTGAPLSGQTQAAAFVRTGLSSWRITFVAADAALAMRWFQSDGLPCAGGQWWEVSAWVYCDNNGRCRGKLGLQFGIDANTNFFDSNTVQVDTGDIALVLGWQQVVTRIQVPPGKSVMRMLFQGVKIATGTGASVSVDDVGLRLVDTVPPAPFPSGATGAMTAIAINAAQNIPITFPAQADTNYNVIVNGNTVDCTYTVTTKTASSCTIVARNKSTTAAVDPGCSWMVVPAASVAAAVGPYDVGQVLCGYGQILTTQPSPGATSTAFIDVTGLACTAVLSSTRRYRVSLDANAQSTVGGDRVAIGITDNGTSILQTAQVGSPTTGTVSHFYGSKVLIAPTTGAHTFQAQVARASGATGTCVIAASAVAPSYIMVEDIGPA